MKKKEKKEKKTSSSNKGPNASLTLVLLHPLLNLFCKARVCLHLLPFTKIN